MKSIFLFLFIIIHISSCEVPSKEVNADPQMDKMEAMNAFKIEEHINVNTKILNSLENVILDSVRLNRIRKVREVSLEIIKKSHQLSNELCFINGGRNEDGSYRGPNNTDKIEFYFKKPNNEWAWLVEKTLPEYIEFIRLSGGNPTINTIDVIKNGVFKYNKLMKDKNSTGMLFDGTTTLQALIMASFVQEEILSLEQEFYHQQLLEYTIELNTQSDEAL